MKVIRAEFEDEDGDEQIEYSKEPHNRTCSVPGEDYRANWWLRDVVSASYFAGYCNSNNASTTFGVRIEVDKQITIDELKENEDESNKSRAV